MERGSWGYLPFSEKKKWPNKAGIIWGPGPFWSLKSVGKYVRGTVHSARVNGESVRSNCPVTCWFWHCLLANWMEFLKQDCCTPSLMTMTVSGLWSLTSSKASSSIRSLCSARIWRTVKRCQGPSSALYVNSVIILKAKTIFENGLKVRS